MLELVDVCCLFHKISELAIPILCVTNQGSRKMKVLWGKTQDGTAMYSYLSHMYLLQLQVILNILDCMHVLHFELSYKQKDLTDYKH